MKIEMTQTRYVVGLGLKNSGDVVDVAADLGRQLIGQGYAREHRAKAEKPAAKTATMTEPTEPKET